MKFHFDIDFDLANYHEAQFLDWYDKNNDNIKQALLCGFFVVTQGIEKYCETKDNSIWQQKYTLIEKENKELKNIYDNVYDQKYAFKYQQQDQQISLLKKQFEESSNLFKLQYASELEEYKQKLSELHKEYNDYIKTENVCEKEKKIKELCAELNVFKTSNQYKGAIGELTIQNLLQKHFTNYEIRDTSGEKSMSDLHLVDKDNNIIAIECKNKSAITAQDIEKSYVDIKTLKDKYKNKFIGYFFISLRCENIPKKGNVYYEVYESRPVLWYGVNDVDLRNNDIVNVIKLLIAHKNYVKDVVDLDANIILTNMNNYLLKISENTQTINTLIKSIESFKKSMDSLEKNNNWMYSDILNLIGKENIMTVSNNTTFECSKCKKAFKRQNELTKHIKLCSSSQPSPSS